MEWARFDLVAKFLWLKYREYSWATELYLAHLKTFNGGWEYPGTKTTPSDFLTSFERLATSIQTGYRTDHPLRFTNNGVLAEGGHRLACCWYYGIIPTRQTVSGTVEPYDYRFFTHRLDYSTSPTPSPYREEIRPLLDKWSDRIALGYFELPAHLNLKTIVIFPCAPSKFDSEVETLLRKEGYLYYHRSIPVRHHLLENLIIELYDGEVWSGYTRADKTRDCRGPEPVRLFLFLPREGVEMVELKARLRQIYGGRHSLHINDTVEEAQRCARVLLNENSRHLLTLRSPNTSSLEELPSFSLLSGVDREEFLLTGSTVLQIYGLRSARDLDYLSKEEIGDLESHRTQLSFYPASLGELLTDPQHLCWHRGVKFLSLSTLRKMKEKRGEVKDRADLRLIEPLLRIKIAFHLYHFTLRGTEIAVYDYAHYVEKFLGCTSIIVVPSDPQRPSNPATERRFTQRFPVFRYRDQAELDDHLHREKVDLLYIIKGGKNDGLLSEEIPTTIHCVFEMPEPHGVVYAGVSSDVTARCAFEAPVVPHMIDLPRVEGDLRAELGIPPEAVVYGRYGGNDSFNQFVTFVLDVMEKVSRRCPQIYFLLINVPPFCSPRSNIIHLPPINDLGRKVQFIQTCDAMLHARAIGESFGLSCGEFAQLNRPVITFWFARDKFHLTTLGEKAIIYHNKSDLWEILTSFRYDPQKDYRSYLEFTPEKVIAIFEKVFLAPVLPHYLLKFN